MFKDKPIPDWKKTLKWMLVAALLLSAGLTAGVVWERQQAPSGTALPAWISIVHTTSAEWTVVSIVYLDETQSGGRVNIYGHTVDEKGNPVSGVPMEQDWPDDKAPPQWTVNGTTDWPQSGDSSFDPGRGEAGPYCIYVLNVGDPERAISEKVCGLGLPLKRHVVYEVTLKRGAGGGGRSPTPSATPSLRRATATETQRATATPSLGPATATATPDDGAMRAIVRDELSKWLSEWAEELK